MSNEINFICNGCSHKWNLTENDYNELYKLARMKEKLMADPMASCDRMGSSYLDLVEEADEKLNQCPACNSKNILKIS